MARAEYSPVVTDLRGASAPGKIHRQKIFRDAKGRIIGSAKNEYFEVEHPRNWKRKPAEGDELANQKSWGKAAFLTQALLNTDEGHAYLDQRFTNQLPSTRGSHHDPLASSDAHTHTYKRYMRFDAYCRAIIRNLLKITCCSTPQEALLSLRQHE
jgi:hypothetical protein